MTKLFENLVNKKVITVNLSEPLVNALDKLKKAGLIPSRSDAIRQMLYFAFPYFLGLQRILNWIGSEKFIPDYYDIPEKPKKPTLKKLRKIYPNLPEYRFMNEEK